MSVEQAVRREIWRRRVSLLGEHLVIHFSRSQPFSVSMTGTHQGPVGLILRDLVMDKLNSNYILAEETHAHFGAGS